MGLNNSSSKFYFEITVRLHNDIAEKLHVCNRTLKYERLAIARRMNEEGLSFLTKTLPAIGKAVDTALATGSVLSVPSFKKARNSALPRFLGWLLERIFDKHTGLELDINALEGPEMDTLNAIMHRNRAIEALTHLRQFVYTLYKLKIPYDEETSARTIAEFIQTDDALKDRDYDPDSDNILEHARRFTSDVFGMFDEMAIMPSHGPGSVATGETTIEKTQFKRLYLSIEQKYPFTEYYMFNLNHVVDDYRDLGILSLKEHSTAKVVLVPKDSRGPRLISCEPLEVQWIQQGLGKKMASHLEKHHLTRGHVNFTDQRINRTLALTGSMDHLAMIDQPSIVKRAEKRISMDWVTLDMKEASDRVSMHLVKDVFALCPKLLDALIATRSSHTMLPDGMVKALNKFAPMGSCLCFPVESFIFYALIISAMVNEGYSRREARASVFVYGDDIIMRRKDYPIALQTLPKYGLMFNASKCCTSGFFRESCGCDAYRGVDVTPTRLRAVWSSSLKYTPDVLLGYVAFHNAMRAKGYHGVSDYIQSWIIRVYGRLPYSTEKEECTFEVDEADWLYKPFRVSKFTCDGAVFYTQSWIRSINISLGRWNSKLQRPEYKTWVATNRKVQTTYDGYPEMLRRMTNATGLGRGTDPLKGFWSDPGSHETDKYAVRHRSRLQRRWVHLRD